MLYVFLMIKLVLVVLIGTVMLMFWKHSFICCNLYRRRNKAFRRLVITVNYVYSIIHVA